MHGLSIAKMAEAYTCGDFRMKNLKLFLGPNEKTQEETTAALLSKDT